MKPAAQYSPELAEEVCVYLASGLSLRKIQELDGMPNKDTVIRWTLRHPEFQVLYDQARKMQAEIYADEIVEISDGEGEDTVTVVNRDRLRVDARKWICTSLLPKFTTKLTQEHTGKDGAPLVTPVINVTMEGNANSGDKLAAALASGAGTHDKGN